jgi:hypothetical protein
MEVSSNYQLLGFHLWIGAGIITKHSCVLMVSQLEF